MQKLQQFELDFPTMWGHFWAPWALRGQPYFAKMEKIKILTSNIIIFQCEWSNGLKFIQYIALLALQFYIIGI